MDVLRFHVRDSRSIEAGGVELLVHIQDSPGRTSEGHAKFGFSRDEVEYEQSGQWHHPALSTITYLSHAGAPTVIFESRSSDQNRCGGPSRSYVSYPVAGKHIAFHGDLMHSSPSELSAANLLSEDALEPRVVLIVNIWSRRRPQAAQALNAKVASEMSNTTGCFGMLNRSWADQQPQRQFWTGRRAGRGEVSLLKGHEDGMTASLPVGFIRQALRYWAHMKAADRGGSPAHTFYFNNRF